MIDILLVEDNFELSELMRGFLIKAGYVTHCAFTGEEACEIVSKKNVRLILLDIMLPNMDGFSVCKHIRGEKDVPILMLSARSDKDAKMNAYEFGADDYLEKPIDVDILLAKIKALFKRFYEKSKEEKFLESGGIFLDLDAMKVNCDGLDVNVTIKEFELLRLFLEHEGKTLNKDFIFHKIWGIDSESEYQTLTVHVKMLRDKIEKDIKNPKRIKTVWGVGYRYEKS